MPRGVITSSPQTRRAARWWSGRSGRLLLERAAEILPPWIARLKVDTALQLGEPLLWKAVPPNQNWVLLNDGLVRTGDFLQVVGSCEELPFAAMRFDLVLLPFCLSRRMDRQRILEECWRVLRPEGHILILDFNPSGSLGMLRRWHLWRRDRNWPWRQPFLSLPQLRRSLEEVGFTLRQGRYFQYTMPGLWKSSQWLELVGDRWWPTGANAYILLAQRREPEQPLVGVSSLARPRRKLLPKLAKAPVAFLSS